MREILFRGRRVDNGEWVEGFLVVYRERPGRTAHFIIEDVDCNESASTAHLVLPETVGQWTGLYDKNKARIWEGDVLQIYTQPDLRRLVEVKWKQTEFSGEWYYGLGSHNGIANSFAEVIGNIHDTPSLLNDKNV